MSKISKKHPIALLVGTRPELIKMAPVIRELQKQNVPFIFIHSNQHYSQEMDAAILADLALPKPDYHLHVGSASHAVQTGKIMEGVERICILRKPSLLVVHGDTNTTLGGALTAKKLHIAVGHVEAGLRSFDYKMPEEINRILTDRLSDILFAPTELAKQNLLADGIPSTHIIVTGNTIVDAVQEHLPLAMNSKIKTQYQIPDRFIVITAHRAENVDSKKTLSQLLELVEFVHNTTQLPIFWPMHPRTKSRLLEFDLQLGANIHELPPIGYLDMLCLLNSAELILTDSGGIQEEAYILKRPLITLRDSTERPETLSANFIVHMNINKCKKAITAFAQGKIKWGNEFGTGAAAKRIVAGLLSVQ